ncbi:phosphatase PAP2 family protein [Streptomyces violaceusniger]|uniref:phosphatase PAP2 family protein n=1 Tax=Streptomyces violaceusniger TaxID=68280 RepID=UPI0030032A4B
MAAGLLIGAALVRAPRARRTVAALIGCRGAAVGLTRVHLGVHWFSDVIGGWLFAAGSSCAPACPGG